MGVSFFCAGVLQVPFYRIKNTFASLYVILTDLEFRKMKQRRIKERRINLVI
jgi:hypothetical protein